MISDRQLRAVGLSADSARLLGPPVRALAFVLVVAAVVEQSVVCAVMLRTTVTERKMGDFAVFYASAARARQGADPYAPGPGGTAAPNLNPPHVTLLLEPMTRLSPAAAFALWTLASCLSAAWAIRIIFHEIRLRVRVTTVLWTSLALLAAAPTGAQWYSAQVSWLLWGPVTWAWAAARRGRGMHAALALGSLASIKPFIGVPALVCVVKKDWKGLAAFAGVASACVTAGVLTLGRSATMSWFRGLKSVTWGGHIFNTSIFGWLTRLFGTPVDLAGWKLVGLASHPALVLPLWLIGGGLVLSVTVAALVRFARLREEPARVDRMWAAALSGALLMFPFSWIYYLCLLAGPYAALCADAEWWTALGARRFLLSIPAVSLFVAPGVLAVGQPSGWATLGPGSAYFWGVAALWMCAVASAYRTSSTAGRGHPRPAPTASADPSTE